ncbi:MAG: hypothetical protein Q4D27_01830 [Coriobacteriia bacterium]|nr:hypothetical protein [Coriobacteriia bacterium]
MVNIALCGDITLPEGTASEAIARCAQSSSLPQPAIHTYANAIDMLEHIDNQTEPLLDLIVVKSEQSGMSSIQIAHDARRAGFAGEIMLVSSTESHAADAQRIDVREYLVDPIDCASFVQAIAQPLRRISAIDEESIVLRVRSGLRRIAFWDFMYARTSNHDQSLHLRDGSVEELRCTSQDLFDRFSHDPRFLKLGSSYIVNLDLVRSLVGNGSTFIFVDNSTASVPVRFRKSAQDSLLAHADASKRASSERGVAHA